MTTIELTEEQQRALQAEPGKRINFLNPVTQQVYVLLAREQYERVRTLLEQPRVAVPRIPQLMLQSMQAYWRDLPDLLKMKLRKQRWVAYHADERVGFGRSQVKLYQECFRRGFQRGEFYVGKLEADPEGLPPWGKREGDWSLYEVSKEDAGTLPPIVE
jgi:hypothetical protein